MKETTLILMVLSLIIPSISLAHPGRTDSSGCHTCRTNCSNWGLSTGEYHCHRSKGITQPIEPVRSIRNESGVGTTVPAPEYKVPVNNTVKTQPVTTTPTVKAPPNPIKEKPIIPKIKTKNEEPKINEPQRQSVIDPTTTEIKRPVFIKRFFNWLF